MLVKMSNPYHKGTKMKQNTSEKVPGTNNLKPTKIWNKNPTKNTLLLLINEVLKKLYQEKMFS